MTAHPVNPSAELTFGHSRDKNKRCDLSD